MTERKFINVPIIGVLKSDNTTVEATIIERIITDGKKEFIAKLSDGRRLYCELPDKSVNNGWFTLLDEMSI